MSTMCCRRGEAPSSMWSQLAGKLGPMLSVNCWLCQPGGDSRLRPPLLVPVRPPSSSPGGHAAPASSQGFARRAWAGPGECGQPPGSRPPPPSRGRCRCGG